MFDLYFSYNDILSKKIIMFIYEKNINKQVKINLLDISQSNQKYKKIPLLIDHNNKKIVEKSKIFDYLKDYIDSLKEIKNKSMSIEHLNNIESNKTLNVKPFNDCESKLSSLYCYIDFQCQVASAYIADRFAKVSAFVQRLALSHPFLHSQR